MDREKEVREAEKLATAVLGRNAWGIGWAEDASNAEGTDGTVERSPQELRMYRVKVRGTWYFVSVLAEKEA
jgi:hypothetical protein